MAVGLYPVFEPKLRGTKMETLGETVAAELGDLEEIALESELTPLSAFMDNREAPEDFDGAPEELAEALGPWDEWFSPAAGAAAIEALAASVGDHENGDAIAEELRDIARAVAAAAKVQGMKFRLELG